MRDIKVKGSDYLSLALLAFGGLGLEVVLAFLIEPVMYGVQMNQWSVVQNIIHWVLTCFLWGLVILILIKYAARKYEFILIKTGDKLKPWRFAALGLCVAVSLAISYFDWNGIKVLKEWNANGWLKFIFQYLYYIFEAGLIILIVIFGQAAGEIWFQKKTIPYGGILTSITWGLTHILTQGDLKAGIICAISGIIFGTVYLLVNKNIKYAYPLILLLFLS